MAIPVLANLDLQNKGQIIKFRVENAAASGYSNAEAGGLIYDSGTLKYYNGSAWVALGTGSGSGTVTQVDGGNGLTGSVTSSGALAVGAGTGITVNANDVAVTAAQTGITSIYNTALKVGRAYADATDHEMIDFATDGMIKLSVNGGEVRWNGSALIPGTDDARDLGSSTKQWRNLYIDGTAEVDALTINGTGSVAFTSTLKSKLDAIEASADVTDATNVQSAGALMDSEVTDLAGIKGVTISTLQTKPSEGAFGNGDKTKLDGVEASADVTDTANVKSALNASFGGTATIGDGSDTFTIPGNLVVTGTTTTNNVETVSTSNGVIFEGNAADANEVTLLAASVTADRTITLPDATGTVVLADATQTLSNKTIAASQVTEISNLSAVEGAQLENINSVTISNAQWGYLGSATAFGGSLIDDANASAARTTLGVDAAGTDNSTNVTLAGKDYLTISSQEITANAIDLTDDVSGILPAANLPDASETAEGVIEIADAGEAQAGTNSSKALTPHNLTDRYAKGVIDVSSINSSALKAVVPHALGTKEVLVECFGVTTGERLLCEYHTDNNGSSSSNHLTFHFSGVPSEDINVYIVSVQGTSAVTPTYPSS